MSVTTPTPVELKNEVVTADVFRVSGIFIGLPNSGKCNSIDLIISAGQSQDDGTVVWVEDKRHRIEDEADTLDDAGNVVQAGIKHFTDVVSRLTGGKTVYEDLRDIVYAYAQERGWIPTDAVMPT